MNRMVNMACPTKPKITQKSTLNFGYLRETSCNKSVTKLHAISSPISSPFFNFIINVSAFHPFDRQKVNKSSPYPIPGGILRYPKLSRMVGDRNLNYPKPVHLHQGRHEPMHPLVKLQVLK